MSENPYAAPQSPEPAAAEQTGAREIRKAHLSTEASVKSIGSLYYLGALFLILSTFSIFTGPVGGVGDLAGRVGIAIACLVPAIVLIVTGAAVRRLKTWARIPVAILSAIGLLAFPIGTILNLYILYLVFCRKGSMVFSPAYREIIAATPDVKYKSSMAFVAACVVILLLVGLGIAAILHTSR